jgi:membrane protease YdiL (CAAX protease family)
MLQNIILGLPQVALILFIILTRGRDTRENAGIVGFRAGDTAKVVATTAGLLLIALPSALLGGTSTEGIIVPVAREPVGPAVLLLLLPVCLVSGYREELFFRSYLLTELEPFGRKSAVAASSLLFAAGHIYQGIGALITTALIGFFLAWLFLRTRNVHVIGLSHALYNFLILSSGAF